MEESLQFREQKLIATIHECSKIIREDSNHFVMLLESVTGISNIPEKDISEMSEIKFSDFKGLGVNKYAYLQSVNNYIDNVRQELILPLNENHEIDVFKTDLIEALKSLQNIDDYTKLDNLDSTIMKTKLFSRQPINILGYNIMNVLERNDKKLFGEIFSIIYDPENKCLYFVIEGNFAKYDITTNIYTTNNPNQNLKISNYKQFFKQLYSPNIIEIFKDPRKTVPKLGDGFTDNIFSDNARTQEVLRITQNQQKIMQ